MLQSSHFCTPFLHFPLSFPSRRPLFQPVSFSRSPADLAAEAEAGSGGSRWGGLPAQLHDAHHPPRPQAGKHPRGGAKPRQDRRIRAAQFSPLTLSPSFLTLIFLSLVQPISLLSPAPLSLQQRLKLAAGAADGVAYLHSFTVPIIHRDLKPGNILVGEHSQAKIADFGLLKLLSHANGGDERTRVAGTPGYLDPDYARTVISDSLPGYLDPDYNRTHVVSDKSDVYSFGVVLVELLTGLLPIFAHSPLIPSPDSHSPLAPLCTRVQLWSGAAGAADGAQGSSGGHRQPHQRLEH
ncbi:unnamed protein product [Closterium sp. Yama58-4]|nr:unnamed protein product [Closterium sp. Yama58-4]